MDYKNSAKEGARKVIDEIRPQAEADDNEEVLDLCDEIENSIENGQGMKAVKKLEKLKEKAEEAGYGVDL